MQMLRILKPGWAILLLAVILLLVSCRAGMPPLSPFSAAPLSPGLSAAMPAKTTSSTVTPAPSSLPGPDPSKLGTVEKDVTYGIAGNVSLKMDIYYPKTASVALPVAMYVHGGGWTGGDKAAGAGVNEIPEMIKRGYLVAAINYRLAPQYRFPAMIEDVKCAVRFLRAKASTFGLDPGSIGVWGGSAGGHLVALLGTTDAGAGMEGTDGYPNQSSRVQAVVDFFGPADLNIFFQRYQGTLMKEVFGAPDANSDKLKVASPVTYISRDDPPFLIIHGDKDTVVPLSQSQILYDRMVAGGVTAVLVIVKNAGHGFVPAGGVISPSRSEITNTVADFFDKYLK
jgi:acetyl esterase/lipase